MSSRGVYGRSHIGADLQGSGGSSLGTLLIGGLAVGSVVLWVRHQSRQIEKLYAIAGMPYEGFGHSLSTEARVWSGKAQEKLKSLAGRFGSSKEISDGT